MRQPERTTGPDARYSQLHLSKLRIQLAVIGPHAAGRHWSPQRGAPTGRKLMTEAEGRLAIVKRQIATRLAPVCVGWPRDLFDSMVDRLAAITIKYDHGGVLPGYDRRSSDRLIADLKAALERSEESHHSEDRQAGGGAKLADDARRGSI